MIITNDCIPCLMKQVQKTTELVKLPPERNELLTRKALSFLADTSWAGTPPGVAKDLYAMLYREMDNQDPYREIKKQYNAIILDLEDELSEMISKGPDSFITALKLAISGNIIDFGTHHRISRDIILNQVATVEEKPILLDDSGRLKSALENAETLLYLGDNCGEIVFDKVFIQYLKENYPGLTIRYAVRGVPIINDVTMEDARQCGLDKIVEVISNGDSTPGTLLSATSALFREHFYNSDLVISKGQGNYETLNTVDRRDVFLLFMAKCEPVAASLKVPQMSLICVER